MNQVPLAVKLFIVVEKATMKKKCGIFVVLLSTAFLRAAFTLCKEFILLN